MRRLFLAVVMILTLGVTANAQTFRGAINGTVTDPSGSSVPNAQVKATESATGIDHVTVTTSDGAFAFQDIPLGQYKVTVTAPGYGGYSVGGFGSMNGARTNQNNWQIDGVDNNDFWHNIPAVNQGGVSGIAGVVLPIDSIDEFSSQTQSGAESGRNAGGTVNLIIKSGSNTIHGTAYYYNRNEFYGAHSAFFSPSATTPKAPPVRNQNFGFSVGGPVVRNKLFYFVSFEKQQYLIGL